MNKLLLSLVLLATPGTRAESQTHQWVEVGITDDTTYSIDAAGVVTTRGGMVEVWIKAAYARRITERKGDQHDWRAARYRIDCASSTWRSNEVVYYRGTTLVRRTSSAARAGTHKPLWPREREMLGMACEIARERSASQEVFWSRLQTICGKAFGGRLTEGSAPGDSAMRRATLVMHVRSCTPGEMRIAFHVDTNRSRTWVLTRTADGLRLKHDHRHHDGTEDSVTQYGGDTKDSGSVSRQEFHADAHTASLIPAARTNIWTMEIVPGERFAYALRRVGTERRFRVEFDLKAPITPPPAPWGSR